MTVDLTDRDDVVFELLKDSCVWRTRAVEKIDLSSAFWADRRRSIEVKPLKNVLRDFVHPGAKRARLHLPVGNFPTGLLIDFDASVAERSAYLLPRTEHTRLNVGFIGHLAQNANASLSPNDLEVFLTAILGFTVGTWKKYLLANMDRLSRTYDKKKALLEYLDGTLRDRAGWGVTVRTLEQWESQASSIAELVRDYGPTEVLSAAENPLLALPLLPARLLQNRENVPLILGHLHSFLEDVNLKAEQYDDADRLLWKYADYGRHWDAVVECEVPLDEPFMIKVAERRELQLFEPAEDRLNYGKPRLAFPTTARQLVVFNDARSNHVNVRVMDTNVSIKNSWQLRDEFRNELWEIEGDKETEEIVAFWDSREVRDFRVWVDIPLRSTWPALTGAAVVLTLSITALAGLILLVTHWFHMGGDKTLSGTDVAVILVPSAIAAALLLVRESSTLSGEITKVSRYVAASVIVILWLFTLVLYGINEVSFGS